MTNGITLSPFLDPIEREAIAWVVLLKSGEATVADGEAFKKWKAQSRAHTDALTGAVRLWRAVGDAEAAADKAQPEAIPFRGRMLSRRTIVGGALAASVAAASVRPPFGMWSSVIAEGADFQTEKGQREQIALADGIDAELNTLTSLSRGQAISGDERRFRLLSGEAVLTSRLPPTQALVVEAGEGAIRTQNASFNARCEGSDVTVTCLEGEVSVSFSGRDIFLSPLQQVSYSREGFGATVLTRPDVANGWRSGLLIFQERPLREVIAEINRYRHGHVMLLDSSLESRVLNGTFYIDRPDEVIAQIQQLFGAKTTWLPGGLVILS